MDEIYKLEQMPDDGDESNDWETEKHQESEDEQETKDWDDEKQDL